MKSARVDIRPTTYRTVDEYRCAVQRLGVSPSVRSVSIDSAVGRVLAEDIVADRALPAFDNSAVDGFAVRAADVADPVDYLSGRSCPVAVSRVGSSRRSGFCRGSASRS